MATAEDYANWIVANKDKVGTPEFQTVAEAYKAARSSAAKPVESDPFKDAASEQNGFQNFVAGMGGAMKGLALGAGQRLGMVDQADVDSHKRAMEGLGSTVSGTLGNVTGLAVPAAATALIPGVNTYTGASLVGGGLGLLEPTGKDESVLRNVALGAAGGAAGQGVANAVGRMIRPVRTSLSPEIASLADKAEQQYAIPLNAAQKTGSKPLQIIDSVLDNLPFTADRQAAEKELQRKAFNRAVLKEVGETADVASPDVLNAARTRIGNQFNNLSANNNVALGTDFLDSLIKIDQSITPFSSPQIKSTVDKALNLAAKGKIDGKEYQAVRTSLTNASKGAWSSDPELGQALKTVRNALDDAAASSMSQTDKEAWDLARKQWGNLKVLEKAAAPTSADAVAGNISPAKLANAVKSSNPQGMLYGTGDQALPDLARIGQALLKEQIPNSGTAQRSFYQTLMTGGPGVAGLMMGNPVAAALAAGAGSITPAIMQKLIHSPAGMRYFSQGLIPATKGNQVLADLLRSGAQGGASSMAIQGLQ